MRKRIQVLKDSSKLEKVKSRTSQTSCEAITADHFQHVEQCFMGLPIDDRSSVAVWREHASFTR
jgi:hypothetical protein